MKKVKEEIQDSIVDVALKIGKSAERNTAVVEKVTSQLYPKVMEFEDRELDAEQTNEIVESFRSLLDFHLSYFCETLKLQQKSADVLENCNKFLNRI